MNTLVPAHYTSKNSFFRTLYIAPFEVQQWIELQKKNAEIQVQLLGNSVQGRPIHSLQLGNGPIKCLLWTQMHGDEPTATKAMADFFEWYFDKDTASEPLRSLVKKHLCLQWIPMVNPDGAAVFKRRNALEIDLNRDFIALQSPESRILKQAAIDFSPAYGFNLHDQNSSYEVGDTAYPSRMAFLAPAADSERSIPAQRKKAMQLIAWISTHLATTLPHEIARYNDAYGPLCFGDNFQKMGISTLLFEGGSSSLDPQKEEGRKSYFKALLLALEGIATSSYEKMSIETYASIPENKGERFYEYLLKNVKVAQPSVTADLAIKEKIYYDTSEQHLKSVFYVADWGDLSRLKGFRTIEDMDLHLSELPVIEEVMNGHLYEGIRAIGNFKKGILHSYDDRIWY